MIVIASGVLFWGGTCDLGIWMEKEEGISLYEQLSYYPVVKQPVGYCGEMLPK